jgi:N-acetylneuraminic acid mutarotase
MAPMPTPRYAAGIAVSPQQTIYVIGGDNYTCVPLTTVEEYDPETNSWRARADLPAGRWALGAVAGADRRIYAIGGRGGEPCGPNDLGTVEAYDPRFDTWTTRAEMPTPRFSLGVVAGANGKIYAIGGQDEAGLLATVEEYDPISDTWTQKGDMPVPNRGFASVSASNGKIYVIGGLGLSNLVWEFDPVADTWVQKASMPTRRDILGAAEVKNGLIYAAGGESWGPSRTVEAYNPATDSWVAATSLAGARRGLAVAAVHKFVYAIGGWGIRADGSESPVGLVEAARTPNVKRPRP